jgi:predicted RND superfamily exporter protein
MWDELPGLILRNRVILLSIILLFTAFMGYRGLNNEITYEFTKLLPTTDTAYIEYDNFKKKFGQDGSVMVIGVCDSNIFTLEKFQAWYDLGELLKKDDLVKEVVSIAHINQLVKNDSLKKFSLTKLVVKRPESQAEVDSIKVKILNLPFYHQLLFNQNNYATLMAVGLDKNIINTKQRNPRIYALKKQIDQFIADKNLQLHYSGLPFVRTGVSSKIQSELGLFVGLVALFTALVLYLFFRSFYVVLSCMIIVVLCVLISTGTVNLFGYKLTSLLGLIPPLIIVIGIPNCVYLINRYHQEFIKHGNKALAIVRIIKKVGGATFLTNLTTAIGFGTFVFTNNKTLEEFGIIASINIMFVFVLSIVLIPVILSFLPNPQIANTKHLENKPINTMINAFINWVSYKRKWIYVGVIVIATVSINGMMMIKTSGKIVDDLPHNDPVYEDLKFFEHNFGGVMPFEITINTGKNKGATQLPFLEKVEKFQKEISVFKEFSPSLSLADAVKYARQTYYNGSSEKYALPNDFDKSFIAPYLKTGKGGDTVLKAFIDSAQMITRISVQMADIGTIRIDSIRNEVNKIANSIFPKDKYQVSLTGSSVVFMKGTGYLIDNLIVSLIIAIFIIAGLMALLFKSFRMVLISILPNLIPLLVTAAIMGYFGINLKPSTILVFSIAFGISVDDTIHYLAKYRQEVKSGVNKDLAVIKSLQESGVSMAYTSIILFCGFSVFMASSFGGNVALGLLVSVTLLVAMISNLLFLPSLLLSTQKRIIDKAMSEPLSEMLTEAEDRKDDPEDENYVKTINI